MSTLFFLLLLILPIFNAQHIARDYNNDDELLAQRSAASSFLCMFYIISDFNFYCLFAFISAGLSMRQYQNQLYDPSTDSYTLFTGPDRHDQQREKRIYWENLAFHAADYNQKPKKV